MLLILRAVVRYQLLGTSAWPCSKPSPVVMSEQHRLGLSPQLVAVPHCNHKFSWPSDVMTISFSVSLPEQVSSYSHYCHVFLPACHLALNFILKYRLLAFFLINDLTFYLQLPYLYASCRLYCLLYSSQCIIYSRTCSPLPYENMLI